MSLEFRSQNNRFKFFTNFFSGRAGSKLSGQWPYKNSDPTGMSIPSVGPILINWIRRRCCRYPYSPVPFSLAAKGLGVQALHFFIFRRTPSGR